MAASGIGGLGRRGQLGLYPYETAALLGADGLPGVVRQIDADLLQLMCIFPITYPRDQIRTVVFLGRFARITFLPAVLMVGMWFLTQL